MSAGEPGGSWMRDICGRHSIIWWRSQWQQDVRSQGRCECDSECDGWTSGRVMSRHIRPVDHKCRVHSWWCQPRWNDDDVELGRTDEHWRYTGDLNLQDWKMTEYNKSKRIYCIRWKTLMCTTHTHIIVSSINLKTYIIPHLELYLLKYDKKEIINDHSTSCVPVL